MRNSFIAAALAVAVALSPLALAGGLLPVNPIVNGNFDTYLTPGASSALKGVMDNCVGVGHQFMPALYWPDETRVADATAHANSFAASPNTVHECDPNYRDLVMLNAWEKTRDRGFMWSNDPGTTFDDFDGDGDREAIIPTTPVSHTHNMWQSIVQAGQAFSLDFDTFEFTVETGAIPAAANNQIGFSLTPGYEQNPWVGVFWEGAVLFRSNDMVPDPATGRVSMDPVVHGEIICPGGYTPCLDFKDDYYHVNSTEEDKRALLSQLRIGQISFWRFNSADPVVIDDVAIVGAKTAAEMTPGEPNPFVP